MAQQLFLLFVEIVRNLNHDTDPQIAATPAAYVRDPATAKPKDGARFGGPRDDEILDPVERLVFDMSAQARLGKRNVQLMHEVIAISTKDRVGSHADMHIEVAVTTTADAGRSTGREPQGGAIVDTRWYFDAVGALLNGTTLAFAHAARAFNFLAETATTRTRRCGYHLAENGLTDTANLARSTALITRAWMRADRRARAITRLTTHCRSNRDFALAAKDHIVEFEIDVRFEIFTARGAARATAAAATATATEERFKDVPKASTTSEVGALGLIRAKAVEPTPTLGIGQDFVGGAHLFEFGFRPGITWIQVGMVGARELLVRALDLFFCRAAVNPQRLVIIAHLALAQDVTEPTTDYRHRSESLRVIHARRTQNADRARLFALD